MRSIQFTQYLRPDGHRAPVEIEVRDEVADKADRIVAAGYRFECEHLTTGHASLTISNDKHDLAIEVVPNGPDVPLAVDRLILDFGLVS